MAQPHVCCLTCNIVNFSYLCPRFEHPITFSITYLMQKIYFFFLLTLLSCTAGDAQSKLDAAQTKKMLQNDRSVQLVDLRTPVEIQQTGKIEGALTINFNDPAFQAQIARLDKTRPVLLYCAAGGRSGRASTQLVNMGFQKVYDYAGGMNDWKAKGQKTTP